MERVCFGTHTYDTTCGSCNRAVALVDFAAPVVEVAEEVQTVVPEQRVQRRIRRNVDELIERAVLRERHRDALEDQVVQDQTVQDQTVQEEVVDTIWRCNLCPRTDDERIMMPPEPENMATAPRCTLMCGHEVHTHCVFNIIYGDNFVTRCGECEVSFLRPQAFNHYHQNNRRQPENTNIKKLWEENQEFRKEICMFKKKTIEVNSLQKKYLTSVSDIKGRFRDVIKTNIEIIKMQKKLFSKELSALPGRRLFLSKATRLKNLKRRICQKYDVDSYDTFKVLTEDATLTPKPPKFSKDTYRSLWRFRTNYIFRVRI